MSIIDSCSPTNEISIVRKYDLQLSTTNKEHDYCCIPNGDIISEFKESAIQYIAGYVCKMVEKQIYCMPCCKALGSRVATTELSFVKYKDRGGLFKPSTSVVKVNEVIKFYFI